VKSRLHLSIYGNVQGVFFRANAQSVASRLAVAGWIKNNEDGSVELMAEGDPQNLRKLLEWCKKGPAGAAVQNVEETWGVATGEFSGFDVIR
jgi:acylphosphatase